MVDLTGDRRSRIAQAALSHVDCSASKDVDRYNEVIVRPADDVARMLEYFDHDPKLSTCALFAVGALRLAGCSEPECVAPYLPAGGAGRDAMVDIQTLARRFGAWVSASTPMALPRQGDVWIIADVHGMDAHTGVCTSDAVAGSSPDVAGGVFTVDTAEGGQFDGKGSTAIGAFHRAWHLVANRWMLGSRYLLGYASAGSMPVPDTADDAGPDPHVDPTGAAA